MARRLLATDIEDGPVVVGVAHEAFLSSWPPLGEAILAASTALRARRFVHQAAADRAQHGRPPDRLWEPGQLAAALADTGARLQTSNPSLETGSATRPPEPAESLASRRIHIHPRVGAKAGSGSASGVGR